MWGEQSKKKLSNVEAQAKIARLYAEGKLVVRGLDLDVNLEVGSLKRVVAENPLAMLAEAASDPQNDITAIQEEISRVRRVYTILNKYNHKDVNLQLSSYLKRLVEEEKLITLILNINKEETPKRHAIYVEGVGDDNKTIKEIFKGCQSILSNQDNHFSEDSEEDRNLLNELIRIEQGHEGEPVAKKARLEQVRSCIGSYTLQDPSKLLVKYLDNSKYTAIRSSEIQQKPRQKVEKKEGSPPEKKPKINDLEDDVVVIVFQSEAMLLDEIVIPVPDDHNSELASNANHHGTRRQML